MGYGYTSDIGGNSAMDSPETTISIDPTVLTPQQALALIQVADSGQQNDWVVGMLADGEMPEQDINDIEFHVPVEAGITALTELGVVQNAPREEAEEEDNE